MARYGLPYMGSKSKIADWVLQHIPQADVLVDVFAGGCSVTHAALLNGNFKRIIANDKTDAPQLFLKAANGEFQAEKRWFSHSDFERLKDSDPYVRLIWSFGGNNQHYLYSRELEPYKKALHEMLTAETLTERRLKFKKVMKELQKIKGYSERTVESAEHLERLKGLQALQGLNVSQLAVMQKDYKDVEILPNSVVYADPPYKGVQTYGKENFNHEEFYDWCRNLDVPVIISEYEMPPDFVCIAEKPIFKTLSATNNKCRSVERLFTII